MEQPPLFFEDLFDALRHVVHASGGAKVVGPQLFPHIEDPVSAGRSLMNTLNTEREYDNLKPWQVMKLLRIGHDNGCHVAITYICDDTGYTRPEPVEPEDTRAALQREFIAAVERMDRIASRMGVQVSTNATRPQVVTR